MSKPSVSYLRECFRLDETSGKLFWRVRPVEHFRTQHLCNWWNARYAGKEAGYLSQGYRNFELNLEGVRTVIGVHRAIYALVHGEWPPDQVDHWNRNRADNRPSNLKPATHSQQRENSGMYSSNTSGFRGIVWHKGGRRHWQARINANGKTVSLGYFYDPKQAHAAYRAAKARLHTYQPE